MHGTHCNIAEHFKKDLIGPFICKFEPPTLFVERKNETLCVILDFRVLSELTVQNGYPPLSIDDLFDQLPGQSWSSAPAHDCPCADAEESKTGQAADQTKNQCAMERNCF